MKTATAPTRPTARAAGTQPIDFETRLMATGILMDVVLTGTEDAHQAAADARAEAERYLADCTGVQGPQSPPNAVLRRAGDIIRSRGWTQGTWADEDGAVCPRRAVSLAAGYDTAAEADALAVLLSRIRDEFGDSSSSVAGWNDRAGRTRADVLRLLY